MIFRFENIIMHPERSDLELKIRLFMGFNSISNSFTFELKPIQTWPIDFWSKKLLQTNAIKDQYFSTQIFRRQRKISFV